MKLVNEDVFIEEVIGEKVRISWSSPMHRMNVEKTIRNLPNARTGYFIVFTDLVLQTCRTWLRELMLQDREVSPDSIA